MANNGGQFGAAEAAALPWRGVTLQGLGDVNPALKRTSWSSNRSQPLGRLPLDLVNDPGTPPASSWSQLVGDVEANYAATAAEAAAWAAFDQVEENGAQPYPSIG